MAAAMALFASQPAATGDLVNASDTVASAGAAKPLVVCERDDSSKRAFKRLYGKAVYVSAREVIDSRSDGQRWATPRCITPAEFAKLQKMTDDLSYAQIASR
jgi:hypothetical protein